MRAKIWTDGGARINPGPAAIGVIIKEEKGKLIQKEGRFLGRTTNNQAEYQAVIEGLRMARHLGTDEIEVFLDSQLVVRQLQGEYRVKDKTLQALLLQAKNLVKTFKKVKFTHIGREENREADKLVREVLKSHKAG